MDNWKELIDGLLAEIKVNKKALLSFKETAVKAKQFELGATIREMETALFPLTPEQTEARELADKVRLVFQMVELNVSEDVCWLIHETIKKYSKLKGKFSVNDAASLISQRKKLFDTER